MIYMKHWTPEEIRAFRKRINLYQRDFALMLGVTGRYISMLEKGVKKPSKTMEALLNCLEREDTRKRKGE